jgi:hypothetical protein
MPLNYNEENVTLACTVTAVLPAATEAVKMQKSCHLFLTFKRTKVLV